MRIGLDVMGGDYAPVEPILGALEAHNEFSHDFEVVLIGDQKKITSTLTENGKPQDFFNIIHAPDAIDMGEHPTKAIVRKQDSSIVKGFHALQSGEIDAFVGAGNTGAMMVGAMYTIKTIPGIIRPTISSILPKEKGGLGIILDVGANADCKPDVLYQFGIVGSLFVENVYKLNNPKVGLLNIGEEEGKGNLLTQATYSLMKDTANLNFVGNVEGRDLFNGKADVVVCDGFTGNVVLKQAESFYFLLKRKGISDDFFDLFNYEFQGGCPILGVNGPVVVGHGISKSLAIKNMIKLTADLADSNLAEKIRVAFN